MKTKTTKKFLKENFRIINAGNGKLQNLLTFVQPDYYCTRTEGWACDAVQSTIHITGRELYLKSSCTRCWKRYKYVKNISKWHRKAVYI